MYDVLYMYAQSEEFLHVCVPVMVVFKESYIDTCTYSAKFSRRTIFADCRFQKFSGNNFHGPRIPLASCQYCSKISRSLIFQVRCQSAKNAKIMLLENLALYGI